MKKILFMMLSLLAFVAIGCSNKNDDYELSVIAPSGAPGIALADMVKNNSDDYSFEINKTADVLKTAFATKEADVIIAPVNLGAIQYKANETYVLASVITWGNLYFASQKENFSINDLNNSDVLLFGSGTINYVIVDYILKQKNIAITNETAPLPSTKETTAQLISNPNAICLVAEPSLSTAKSKKANINSISVQELYKEITGTNSYPQAGCFVNINTINEHKSVIDEFLNKLEKSCAKCSNNVEEIAAYAEELELGGKKEVLVNAIPNSNISYVKAENVKLDLEKVVAINSKLFGGANPTDEFYYKK